MYDEHSVQIPAALPQQNPTKNPRSAAKAYDLVTTAHAHKRMQERDLTAPQVLQTYVYGHEQPDPHQEPGVSHFVLNSIAHAQMRRRVVVNNNRGEIPTVYREDIPQPTQAPKTPPNNTKAKKKEQLAKKRARGNGGT